MRKIAFWFVLSLSWTLVHIVAGQTTTLEEAKRSMVHLLADDSNCNGVLLNNTLLDGRVLVLTAGHCVTENNRFLSATFGRDILLENTSFQAASWTTTNISVLRLSRDLDYMLLQINESIPNYILPYYAGWNIAGDLPLSTFSIHSPEIEKRFNEDLDRPTFATFDAITTFGGTPVKDATYNIGDWEQGFTQAGSSGAPLFNQWSQMVGILSGGSSSEENPVTIFIADGT
ncbi:MAG: trypsin-like peptidase domain-containing protein [Bacteroidota bacterium]